jgi:hypothetical protein
MGSGGLQLPLFHSCLTVLGFGASFAKIIIFRIKGNRLKSLSAKICCLAQNCALDSIGYILMVISPISAIFRCVLFLGRATEGRKYRV